MTKRYYKATDGQITVYRATESREYHSAQIRKEDRYFGFSALPASPAHPYPAVEIDKAEYQSLVAQKVARIEARKAEMIAAGQRVYSGFGGAPGDSWVAN